MSRNFLKPKKEPSGFEKEVQSITTVQKYLCVAKSRSQHVHLQLQSGPQRHGLDLKTQEQPHTHTLQYNRKHMAISITLLSSDMHLPKRAQIRQHSVKCQNYRKQQRQCEFIHHGNRMTLFRTQTRIQPLRNKGVFHEIIFS